VLKRNKSGPVRMVKNSASCASRFNQTSSLCSINVILLTQYYSDQHIKKGEMGRACGISGSKAKYIQGFDEET